MVKIGGKNIGELASMSVEQTLDFFEKLEFSQEEKIISE